MTSLVGGYRVSKTNARIEAYGTVDELSANLGVLASYMKDGDDKTLIIRTQRNLFTIGSNLATDKSKMKVAISYTLDPEEVDKALAADEAKARSVMDNPVTEAIRNFISDSAEDFADRASVFLGVGISGLAERVEIERY